MFEYTLAPEQGSRGKWALFVSLSGEFAAVALALLIPLIYTEGLPPVRWESISLPPAPVPPPVDHLIKEQPTRPAQHDSKVFTAPPSIPPTVQVIVEQPAAALLSSAGATGVPSGIGSESRPAIISIDLPVVPVAPPPAPIAGPQPVERAREPIQVSGGVQAAKIIRRVLPIYPEPAKRARISGTVRLIGVIGKDGTIQNLRAVSGHPWLVSAAIEAVRQWLYKPTLLSGEPVEVVAPIEVNFNLN